MTRLLTPSLLSSPLPLLWVNESKFSVSENPQLRPRSGDTRYSLKTNTDDIPLGSFCLIFFRVEWWVSLYHQVSSPRPRSEWVEMTLEPVWRIMGAWSQRDRFFPPFIVDWVSHRENYFSLVVIMQILITHESCTVRGRYVRLKWQWVCIVSILGRKYYYSLKGV